MKYSIYEEKVLQFCQQKQKKMDRELVMVLARPRTAEEMMEKLSSLRPLQKRERVFA